MQEWLNLILKVLVFIEKLFEKQSVRIIVLLYIAEKSFEITISETTTFCKNAATEATFN